MPAHLPSDQTAIVPASPGDYLSLENSPRRTGWILLVAVITAAVLFFLLGAKSQTRTSKPESVGPFPGEGSTPSATPLVVHIAGEVMKPGVYEFSLEARVQDALRKAGGPKKSADLNAVNLAAFLEDGQKIEVPSKTILAANPSPPAEENAPAADEGSTPSAPTGAYSAASTDEEIFAPIPELSPRETKPKTRDSEKPKRAKKAAAKPKVLPEVPRATTAQGGESQNADPKYFEKKPLNLNTATQEQLELLPGVGPSTAKKILDARKAKGGFKSVEEIDEIRGIGEKTMEELRPLVTVS